MRKKILKLIGIVVITLLFSCDNIRYVKEYHDNGQLSFEGAYDEKNNEVGIHKWYNQKGIIKQQTDFRDNNEVIISYYHETGELKSVAHYSNYKDNVAIYREYYKTGELLFKGNYEDDSRVGDAYWYYNNGKLKAIANYIKDDKEPIYYEEYDSLGVIINVIRKVYLNFPDTIKAGEVFKGSVSVEGSLPEEDSLGVFVVYSNELIEGVAPAFTDIVDTTTNTLQTILTKSTPVSYYVLSEEATEDKIGKSFYFWGVVNFGVNSKDRSISKTFEFTHTFYIVP